MKQYANSITDLITIRTLNSQDVHFILDSSLQCLSKYTESIFKGMTKQNIYKHLELVVLYALNCIKTYSVFIACSKEDTSQIISYIVADAKTNHILLQYTKYSYRKLGIQQTLLMPLVIDPSQSITVNWPTKEMLKLAKVGRVEIINKLLDKLIEEATV